MQNWISALKISRSSLALSAAVIITLLLWLYEVVVLARPYFAFTTDVEMDFVFRGLALARGIFVDHAFGVFVDVLGAGLMVMLKTNLESLELFLTAGYLTGLAALLVAVWFLVKKGCRHLSPLAAISCVLVFFLHPSARGYLNYWSAELFVFPGAVGAILVYWHSLSVERAKLTRWIFLSGFLAAFAVALKLYFLSFAFAGLVGYFLLWKRARPAPLFRIIAAYGAGGLAGVLVGFLPGINSPRAIGAFFLSRGGGSAVDVLLNNLYVAVASDPLWITVMLFILPAAYFAARRFKEEGIFPTVMCMSMVFGIFLALMQPAAGSLSQPPAVAMRFLLPVAIFAAFASAAIFKMGFRKDYIVYISVIMLIGLGRDFLSHQGLMSPLPSIHNAVFELRDSGKGKIFFGDVPWMSSTLRQGDRYAGGRFAEEISRLYPGQGYQNLVYPLQKEILENMMRPYSKQGSSTPATQKH